jgi:hypothetical protein
MRIHEYEKPVLLTLAQNLNDIIDVLFIVFPPTISIPYRNQDLRSSMFERLPRKDESHNVEAISLYAGEMIIGLREGERCADKADVVCVKEAFADVRRHVWRRRVFGIAPKIDTAKRQDPAKEVSFT